MRHAVTCSPASVTGACALLCLLLAGCASNYDPPVAGDHGLPKYQTDLRRCRGQAHDWAVQIAGATPWTELKSIFASGEPERASVRACLEASGYR